MQNFYWHSSFTNLVILWFSPKLISIIKMFLMLVLRKLINEFINMYFCHVETYFKQLNILFFNVVPL